MKPIHHSNPVQSIQLPRSIRVSGSCYYILYCILKSVFCLCFTWNCYSFLFAANVDFIFSTLFSNYLENINNCVHLVTFFKQCLRQAQCLHLQVYVSFIQQQICVWYWLITEAQISVSNHIRKSGSFLFKQEHCDFSHIPLSASSL